MTRTSKSKRPYLAIVLLVADAAEHKVGLGVAPFPEAVRVDPLRRAAAAAGRDEVPELLAACSQAHEKSRSSTTESVNNRGILLSNRRVLLKIAEFYEKLDAGENANASTTIKGAFSTDCQKPRKYTDFPAFNSH